MPALKVVSSPTAFNLSSYKITKSVASGSASSSYTAASSGAAIGNSGLRIWDTSTLAASGTVTITPSTPLVLPLIDSALPTKLFDAIIDVVVDGVSYPIAFSNAPANIAAYNASEVTNPTNIFWINLLRLRPNASPYSATDPYDYWFGGEAVSYDGGGSGNGLKLNLALPLTASTSFTYRMEYFGSNASGLTPVTGTVVVPASSNTRNIVLASFPSGQLGSPNGYYKVTVTCSDPAFQSLLPFYHWGCQQ